MTSNLQPLKSKCNISPEFQIFYQKTYSDLNIGICLDTTRPQLIKSLRDNSNLCNLYVFSRAPINGLNCFVSSTPSEQMVKFLYEKKIDGLIRGINDDFQFQTIMRDSFHCSPFLRLAILRDSYNRIFAIGPISAAEAKNTNEKKEYALFCCDFLRNFGIKPVAMVMAGCRETSKSLNKNNQKYWNEAEDLVDYLRSNNIEAENVGIELNLAVEKGNIIFPVNGLIGNQIYRSIVFLSQGNVVAVPAFTASSDLLSISYEDNSRNEDNYGQHIRAAIAIAKRKSINIL